MQKSRTAPDVLIRVKERRKAMRMIEYIKPELLVVAIVLYFLKKALRYSKLFEERYLPFIVGAAGILICGIYVFSTCGCSSFDQFGLEAFTAITQGVLVTGLAFYAEKLIKYNKNKMKPEEVKDESDRK